MQVRVTPTGSMDKDTDPQYIRDRNYEDAHDIRLNSVAGGSAVSVTNNKGNEVTIEIPDYTPTAKTYRCYFDTTEDVVDGAAVANYVTARLVDSGLPAGFYEDFTTFTSGPYNVTDYSIELKAFLQTLDDGTYPGNPFTLGPTYVDPIYATRGYFDITQDEIVDTDFELLVTLGNACRFELVADLIPTTTDKSMKIVGMKQIDTDVIVCSCSNHEHSLGHVSEIGVISYDESSDIYSYTRLVKTMKLGFTPDHQIQIEGEKNQDRISIYLTDRNSKPRAIYINKPYVSDGLLEINGGTYNFSTIDSETYLFLPLPNVTVTVDRVNDRGGAITCGNKRYTGRFLTDSLVGTEFLYPTNPVNISPVDSSEPWKIAGGAPGETSTKSVTISVSNIPSGAYKYFELVAIEYSGGSWIPKIVQRYPLGEVTDITVEHTDLGQDNTELSQAEVLEVMSKYNTIGSLAIHDGRLFLSNLTETQDLDLTDWASAITHTLERTSVDAVGLSEDITATTPGYKFGEYQNPQNVINKVGYMWNDTYRFGIQVKWKATGKWSRAYHIDDIRFDFDTTNVTGTTRTVNVTDLNLTDSATTEVYVHYPIFGNIDLDTLIDGVPIYNLIEAYRIVRAERIEEVLTTGIFVTAEIPVLTSVAIPRHYPHVIFTGGAGDNPDPANDEFVFGMSPDIYLGAKKYSYQTGDIVKIFAPFNVTTIGSAPGVKTVSASGAKGIRYSDLSGFFDTGLTAETDFVIDEYIELSDSEKESFGSGTEVSRYYSVSGSENTATAFGAFELASGTFQTTGNATTQARETGFYYGQIFRNLGANLKYPQNKELTRYGSTGQVTILSGNERGIQTESVFGGDIFIQKTHLPYKLPNYASPANSTGMGVGFYSQNTVNSQMRNILENDDTYTGAGNLFPQLLDTTTVLGGSPHAAGTWANGVINWLSQWPEFSNQRAYNTGYNYTDQTILEQGYDPSSTYNGKRPASIIWSRTKTSGSLKDNYRIFKPADIYDLDLINGEIAHIMEMNGALYSWQRDSFMRHYVSEASLVNGGTGSDIIIGSGGVFGAPGAELSSLGATGKWGIIKGRNVAGKDTAYWYNNVFRKIVRFTGAGVDVISDKGFDSYLKNRANYLIGLDEPITNRGINGVWNDRYNEAIFTFKAFKTGGVDEVAELGSYVVGNEVINSDAPVHISGLPFVYKCISAVTVDTQTKYPGTGASSATYWEEISPTSEAYNDIFTVFTIVWDESRNGFRCFHEYWPNLYTPFNATFLTTAGADSDKVWVHDAATYTYYDDTFTPSITSVMNAEENIHKVFEAVQFVTEEIPYRVDFTTQDGTSFLTESDFTLRENFYYSPIKNQAVSGVVTGDTGRLRGKYLKVKVSFETGVVQRLINYIIKSRPSHRLYMR